MRVRTRQAALCILRRGYTFLVAQVTDPQTGHVYHRPPGGGLEPNETPEAAVTREIEEELGITLTDAQPSVPSTTSGCGKDMKCTNARGSSSPTHPSMQA